jgi:alpha-tubulin suppressor-like RCC1 family protein
MSGYLWKYYLEDDVDNFRHVLSAASHTGRGSTQKGFAGLQGGAHGAALNSSPGSHGASPMLSGKGRKMGLAAPASISRADINSRDAAGLTILHHAASSTAASAVEFAHALLEHPWVDVYIQDAENGWTPLHRAFYFGNIAIARLILNRDTQDILGHGSGGFNQHSRGLVKIKDKEGYGPLDLFSMTIKDRTLQPDESPLVDMDSDDEVAHGDSGDPEDEMRRRFRTLPVLLNGDEVYTFGSNKNVTLGFGDQDDRQFPERIVLRRPDHLLQRFYREHRAQQKQYWSSMGMPLQDSENLQPKGVVDLPTHIRNTPLVIQDVQMSKLHTAVLTADPVSNLYVCGHGPGGRLGTGSETTRYQFTCIESGGLGQRMVTAVSLGQNHTLAITADGEIYSWGNNAFGQLGYALPKPALKDEDPISTIPRQIFGPLKRELVAGIAASRIHSVVHTATSLFTFGKNEGQLGIVDSDARSLDMQVIPRKIAASLFSSPIMSVSAIDGASICLLENREVWVFANYGYAKLSFDLDGFTSNFLKESWLTTRYEPPNKIRKITSGGDTICALSTSGQVFTVAVSRRTEGSQDAGTSTTNPKQIRGSLSTPYRIWSSQKSHMAARDVDVDQDGSIILTTEVGSVWRRTKRATIQNANITGATATKPKDYKFQRVPGLTRVVAVRASAYGAYAAVRKDCDVTRNQIGVDELSLWDDLSPMLSFHELTNFEESSDDEEPAPRFWTRPSETQALRKRVLKTKDLEKEVSQILQQSSATTERTYDLLLGTTTSDVHLPLHEFMLSGRSRVLRNAILGFRVRNSDVVLSDLLTVKDHGGSILVLFHGLDFLTIFDLVLYVYTDSVVDFWNVTRHYPTLAYRYRSVRTELMKVASRLEMKQLEPAVRQMVNPQRSLNMDMAVAIKDVSFFESGDVVVDLADGEMRLHSDIICERCPFFEGLFRGRTGGQWLAGRRTEESSLVRVDLTHVDTHLFELVVRHLYTDAGEEIFEDVTSEDLNDLLALDELLDHVMDVMSVANELMLDRLTQICQRLIGRYGKLQRFPSSIRY